MDSAANFKTARLTVVLAQRFCNIAGRVPATAVTLAITLFGVMAMMSQRCTREAGKRPCANSLPEVASKGEKWVGEGARSLNLLIHNQPLCQLSYAHHASWILALTCREYFAPDPQLAEQGELQTSARLLPEVQAESLLRCGSPRDANGSSSQSNPQHRDADSIS